MPVIEEHSAVLGGEPVFWRSAPPVAEPVLYVHGVPNESGVWRAFLERTGGIAVDLPGFGRSTKRADRTFTIAEYDRFLEAFMDHVGLERTALVLHDWGAVALATAQRLPARFARLVIIDAVPLLPGYRWHRIARAWRTPVLGEALMGMSVKPVLRLITREANVTPGPLPDEELERIWAHFDQGTQRAILRLYRSSDPEVLAAAGADLDRLTCPALIVWGEQDPYLDPGFAHAYAARLPAGRAQVVPGAGHWPWLDRPGIIDDVAGFLAGTP
ncbi:MAG: alpha/beta fold hydrolase [Solirubrobacteraceae bacterium]